MTPTKVLICDDHEVVRAGIRLFLEKQEDYEVVGEARDGNEAIALAEKLRPGVVIMDLSMPGLGGLDAIPHVLEAAPGCSVLVLTVHEDEAYFFKALEAGAAGYVLKGAPANELLAALRLVAGGGVPVPAALAQRMVVDHMQRAQAAPQRSEDRLSARELEILPYIAEGRTNKEIAEKLFVSVRTVERFRSSVMNKLGLHSRAQLVSFAVRQGILRDDPGR
jgi:two-component system, NarL family, response regulator NreC